MLLDDIELEDESVSSSFVEIELTVLVERSLSDMLEISLSDELSDVVNPLRTDWSMEFSEEKLISLMLPNDITLSE